MYKTGITVTVNRVLLLMFGTLLLNCYSATCLNWNIILPGLVSLLFVTTVVVISFMFLLMTSLLAKVKIGKPPIGNLTIAYKYGLSNSISIVDIFNTNKIFKTDETVQICYERPTGAFGMAYGAVLKKNIDTVNEETRANLASHGYNIFQVKSVPNGMYICCPMTPWLSYLGVWLVLRIIYPKMYKYSKERRLSAYPVVELYRRFSVVLMAPLSQQDLFVVPEAVPTLHRSHTCLDNSISSLTDHSMSIKRSISISSIKKVNIKNMIKLSPGITSTPKVANGNTKQG